MKNIDYLKILAFEFRKGLDFVVKNKRYGRLTILENFPNGCCRYASDLLAEYFMSKGISRRRIRVIECETMKEKYTHCWLLIDNVYFVDISADQFNGKSYFKKYEPIPSCYVTHRDKKYLYECFNCNKMKYLADVGINFYGGDIPMKLQIVYDEVVQSIERNSKEQ